MALNSSSERKVATKAGADYFGKPVGSVITANDRMTAKNRRAPVTMDRLRSLRRQFVQAKRVGSKPIMAAVNKQFQEEIRIFSDTGGRDIKGILDEMDANLTDGMKDSTELNDTDVEDGNKEESPEQAPED